MGFYYVNTKITSGLCVTICGVCKATPVVAYSGVTEVRAGFVCLTTSAPGHPPNGQGHQSGEKESKALDVHFSSCGLGLCDVYWCECTLCECYYKKVKKP